MIPDSITAIMELIGERDTYDLVKNYGGNTLFFPGASSEARPFISQEAWKRLCSRFGGTYVFIPRCHNEMLLQRNKLIIEDRKNGKSIAECCLKFNLSDRQIKSICSRKD